MLVILLRTRMNEAKRYTYNVQEAQFTLESSELGFLHMREEPARGWLLRSDCTLNFRNESEKL